MGYLLDISAPPERAHEDQPQLVEETNVPQMTNVADGTPDDNSK